MILIDSSVWIDYLNGKDNAQTKTMSDILGQRQIVVTDLIMTEVLQGFHDPKEFNATLRLLNSFPFEATADRRIAVQAARNFVYLRSRGYTMRKTIDSLIATKCIVRGFELLHNDRDFIPFEKHLGLRTVNI
ncbi:MAG: PIN domain nuclease [Acidobacteria bacterium]|nr:PIN domain nuclease [Acidobacteriota bacterium]